MYVTTIGLDLAKNVFQVHGITEDGEIAFNKPIRRAQLLTFFNKQPPCLVGIEACSTSHYWARELTKLGHHVKLMPPNYVKAYVKRGKTDAADAQAICEAVTWPTMRFVPIKTNQQQALLSQHRARELLISQRTQLANTIRGLIGEFGVVINKGIHYLHAFAQALKHETAPVLPTVAQDVVLLLCAQYMDLHKRLINLDRDISKASRQDERVKLLETIPGIGIINASAIVATIGTPDQFKSGREFSAWLGLTPLNRSSGGKECLGKISKMGNRYLRKLLVLGMTSGVRVARNRPDKADPWLVDLLERKPARLATVAMANKTARIIWAVLTRGEPYHARHVR